jgi:hypothetical protein
MSGTVAITDHGWYEFLLAQSGLDEVNFWTPSAHWAFRGDVGSPFFFKLKARYSHAICGFAYFARYTRLPDWLAWETFEAKNGCPTLESMRERIGGIRARIDYRAQSPRTKLVAFCSRSQRSSGLTNGFLALAIGHRRTSGTSGTT